MNAKYGLLLFIAIFCLAWSNGNSAGTNPKDLQACVGLIGFSSAEVSKAHSTGLLQYKKNLHDSSLSGWNRDTGSFTVKCPGVYSVSFSAYGAANAKFTVRKRTISNQFIPIISTPLGGGSGTVVVQLELAEQLSMKLDGELRAGLENTAPVNSFSVYRLAAN